jgi:hypothetical protein
MKKKKIGLSAHTLNIFRECKRCFYLEVKYDIKRPRGPMPSIATGIDSLIKNYFEHFRGKLPPFLKEKIKGTLITDLQKTYYYDIEDFPDYYLWGRLDEAIKLPNGLYIPLDHKTRASCPKKVHDAYKFQLEVYSLLLKKTNKSQEVDIGYLVYYYPEKEFTDFDASEIKNVINFNFEVIEVKLDINEIKKVIKDAINCFEDDKLPESGNGKNECEYCRWIEKAKIYYIESPLEKTKKEEAKGKEENKEIKEETEEKIEKQITEITIEIEEKEEKQIPKEIKKSKEDEEIPESLF